jgi:small subunit ribosomal protein S11
MEKKKKHIRLSVARIYISSSFNNTIVTLTDEKGNVVAWASGGSSGFKGTKKGTPFAAQVTVNKILEKANAFGVKQLSVFISGPGPGRETALRAIAQSGLKIVSIRDITPIPHNGCRPPKPRRV